MGIGRDPVGDEAAHLGAHLLHRFIKAAVAIGCRAICLGNELGKASAGVRCVAEAGQLTGRTIEQDGSIGATEVELGGADEFTLVHGDAAGDLVEVFAKQNLDQQFFHFTEAAFGLKRLGVPRSLAQGLDIGR